MSTNILYDPLFLVDNRQLKAQLKYNEANLAAAEAGFFRQQGRAIFCQRGHRRRVSDALERQ